MDGFVNNSELSEDGQLKIFKDARHEIVDGILALADELNGNIEFGEIEEFNINLSNLNRYILAGMGISAIESDDTLDEQEMFFQVQDVLDEIKEVDFLDLLSRDQEESTDVSFNDIVGYFDEEKNKDDESDDSDW